MVDSRAQLVERHGMNMPNHRNEPDLATDGIIWGKNTTDIGDTNGSLLRLPVKSDRNEVHELIVCLPPQRLKLKRFWIDLIIE